MTCGRACRCRSRCRRRAPRAGRGRSRASCRSGSCGCRRRPWRPCRRAWRRRRGRRRRTARPGRAASRARARCTPAWTRQSRSSALTSSSRSMPVRSSARPPSTGSTWPSSELPAPHGITGTPCSEQVAQDRRDLLGGVRERDGVGLARGEARLVAAVQAEDRGRGGEALAEQLAQRRGGRLVHAGIPFTGASGEPSSRRAMGMVRAIPGPRRSMRRTLAVRRA